MNYKVLVVDDDKNMLETLNRGLIFVDNVEVTLSESPLEAIEIIKREKIHIVIADISMPEMDGIKLLETIKKIDGLVQVIIMTGYSSANKAIECLSLGANDYLLKPFDMNDVKNVLNISIEKLERWKKIIQKSIRK